MFFACSFLFAAACFSLSGRLRLLRCAGITLAFPFFAFSTEGEKREKTYVSWNPCRIAVLRQSRQVECAKPLAFPFGQASPVPLCRHYPCFPLRGEWRKAPREVSLNSALFFKPCPCSFFLRKNSAKIVSRYAPSPCLKKFQRTSFFGSILRLPLASSCLRTMRQKLSALFQGFPLPSSRLPLASSCSRTMRQKLSAASRLPLGGRLLAKQGGEGQLHFRFKILNNSAIPFSIFPLAFPFGNPCRTAAQRQSRQAE